MALDMTKVLSQKQHLEERMARGGGKISAIKWWKPSPGDNRIRVMPGWDVDGSFAGQFWREVAQHWNLSEEQRGPVVCTNRTPGLEGECPVCLFVDELRADKSNVQAQELVREIRAKTTYLLNIVDTSDGVYTAQDVAEFKKARPDEDATFAVGDQKIQVYACPPTVFDQILGIIKINEKDITDFATGHDVVISKHGVGLKTRYETQLILSSTESTVSSIDALPKLDTVGYVMEAGKLLDLLSGGVGGSFATALPETTGTGTTGVLTTGVETSVGNTTTGGDASGDTADSDALLAQMQAELNS